MDNIEKELSRYIDRLNKEKKPQEQGTGPSSPELENLKSTVRLVRSLKEPALPDAGYPKRLAAAVTERLSQKRQPEKQKRKWLAGIAAIAAVAVMAVILGSILPFGNINVVKAMEEAFQEVKAYHGILEVVESNAEGKETVQAKLEVWADKDGRYYVEKIEGAHKGLVTANNGQKKWQLRPEEKLVYLFPAFPDPNRFIFELGKEIEDVRNALETKVVGEESVSGRKAYVLEVSPRGGVPYRIWVDKDTRLPLQKQSGMQNALQYRVTYTEVDFLDAIPDELVAYNLPDGFEEIDTNPEQFVNSMEEAAEAVGFIPEVPGSIPEEYERDEIAVATDAKIIKLYYSTKDKKNKVVILQGKADGELKPDSRAVLGKIGESIAEIQSPVGGNLGILAGGGAYTGVTNISSIRWQHGGFEYAVVGDDTLENLALFAEGLMGKPVEFPPKSPEDSNKPQVEVEVDLEIEENEQKSVDNGHSPWKLDPVFVAQVFVSLKMHPEGIQGDYPINYEELNVIQNTGTEAIVEVNGDKTPISKVYLKKLIRQDSTGIWSVVGYDPSENE